VGRSITIFADHFTRGWHRCGSTLIACQQTGRKAFLMELDPLYCDVIVQRWEKFTGGKAERAAA
jgi:DNA modification methylase